jgi:hypothetical protein
MRVLAAVAAAVVVFGPGTAAAQVDETRFLLSFNLGYQTGTDDYADEGPFTLYDETGRLAVAGETSTGLLWDLSAAYRVGGGRFTIGLGYQRGGSDYDVQVAGEAPDPLFFNRPRRFELTASELERKEQAIHYSLGFLMPLSERADLHLYGGPSQFLFSQQVVEAVTITENPFTVTPNAPAERNGTSWGAHAAADLSFLLWEGLTSNARLGLFARYAGSASEFRAIDEDVDSNLGGLQFGGGLRFRF